MIHRLASSLTLTALLLSASDAHAQNRELLGEYRIGIVGRDQGDAIYQATHLGALDAARKLSEQYSIDIELLVFTPNLEQGGSQPASLAGLFIENADGLIISPAEPETLRPSIEFALEQDQQVVFFEHQIDNIEPLTAFVADEVKAGRLAAKALLKELPSRGRVAILINENPDVSMQDRLKGARTALGYRRIEKVVRCAPDYQSAIQAIRAAQEADRNDLIQGVALSRRLATARYARAAMEAKGASMRSHSVFAFRLHLHRPRLRQRDGCTSLLQLGHR